MRRTRLSAFAAGVSAALWIGADSSPSHAPSASMPSRVVFTATEHTPTPMPPYAADGN